MMTLAYSVIHLRSLDFVDCHNVPLNSEMDSGSDVKGYIKAALCFEHLEMIRPNAWRSYMRVDKILWFLLTILTLIILIILFF